MIQQDTFVKLQSKAYYKKGQSAFQNNHSELRS